MNNESAFPVEFEHGMSELKFSGLTKREWFAGMALQAFIRNQASGMKWNECEWREDELAEISFSMADAMIEESKNVGNIK